MSGERALGQSLGPITSECGSQASPNQPNRMPLSAAEEKTCAQARLGIVPDASV